MASAKNIGVVLYELASACLDSEAAFSCAAPYTSDLVAKVLRKYQLRVAQMGADGEAEVVVSGNKQQLSSGEMIIMPAGSPHSLKATEKFKMMLIMIREK